MVWMWAAAAWAAEPSQGLKALTGTGVVVGTVGATLAGTGLMFSGSPEPFGFVLFYPPGVVLLTAGSGLALGGSLGQAGRVEAPKTTGLVGLAILGAGAATVTVGALSGTEEGAWTAVIAAPVAGVGALVAAGAQGGVNREWADPSQPRVTVLPDLRGRGLVLAGTF